MEEAQAANERLRSERRALNDLEAERTAAEAARPKADDDELAAATASLNAPTRAGPEACPHLALI